jgi:hypothetical protein
MTALAALAAFAAFAVLALAAGGIHALRRRRHDPVQRPLALASPGGRSFFANVGTLSDFRMGLRLPRGRR